MNNRTPYQIPISEFEKKLPLENKKEILELFTNHNEIKSEDEFYQIEQLMQRAYHRGDLELLEIYLNELIELKTESGFLSFKINKSNKTASLFQLFERKEQLNMKEMFIWSQASSAAVMVASKLNALNFHRIQQFKQFTNNHFLFHQLK